MKEKLKAKLPDFLLTLVSSLIALYLLLKTDAAIESYLIDTLKVSAKRVPLVIGTYFSLLMTLIYVIILMCVVKIEEWVSFFSRPRITVAFYDKRQKEAHYIDFKDYPEEPKYLKVSLSAKFSSFQLYILKNLLKAKVLISLNPKMCAIELYEGFIGDNQYYDVIDGSLQCDIFSLFQASQEERQLDIELTLVLVNAAKGEVKANLGCSNSFVNSICKRYCKFKVSDINLEG